jgi:recyclin-1
MLEILAVILDHLAIPELMHFALTSKRLKEMVYDDTRWVQRLQLIGCWNEVDARRRGEDARKQKLEALNTQHEEELKRLRHGTNDISTRNPSIVLSQPPGKTRNPSQAPRKASVQQLEDGFNSITLSPTTPGLPSPAQPVDNTNILELLSRSRSIRGGARQEYGRIYGALNPFYKDAVRSKKPSDAKIFRIYRDPIQQAQMLAQLVKFSKADFTKGWQIREKRLMFMLSAFEDAVSKEYEQGLQIGDVEGRMKKYAQVLIHLNGGERAISRFIAENALLKDGAHLGDPMDCVSPTDPNILFLEESGSFFGHLTAACNAQISIIDRVFPPTVDALLPFFKRVGDDILNPYLTKLLVHLQQNSTDSYVKAVPATYEQSLRFARSLNPPPESRDKFNESVSTLLGEIYTPHVDKYLSDELEYFRRRSDAEVTGWERQLSQADASIESLYMANINRQTDKRDFLSSFRKVIMMPVNVLPTFGARPATAKALVNGEGLEAPGSKVNSRTPSPGPVNGSRSASPTPEPPSTELAAKAAIMKSRLEGIRSLFSLEVALNLVHVAKASIERVAVFAGRGGKFDQGAKSQCEAIFILLLKTLGTRHVRAGFDQAVDHLAKYNPRATADRDHKPGVAPLVMFLELVNVGDLIQQMLDVFYEQELVAKKLTDRNDFLNPTVKEKKRFEQMLDERVAAGLNKGIEVLMAEVEYVCATTQNVEDFNPGATGMVINNLVDVSPSNTAVWIVEVVSAHTKMLVGSTDKNMLDVFNQEVGLRLFAALCKHIKRQRISISGSVKLIRYVRA